MTKIWPEAARKNNKNLNGSNNNYNKQKENLTFDDVNFENIEKIGACSQIYFETNKMEIKTPKSKNYAKS